MTDPGFGVWLPVLQRHLQAWQMYDSVFGGFVRTHTSWDDSVSLKPSGCRVHVTRPECPVFHTCWARRSSLLSRVLDTFIFPSPLYSSTPPELKTNTPEQTFSHSVGGVKGQWRSWSSVWVSPCCPVSKWMNEMNESFEWTALNHWVDESDSLVHSQRMSWLTQTCHRK